MATITEDDLLEIIEVDGFWYWIEPESTGWTK